MAHLLDLGPWHNGEDGEQRKDRALSHFAREHVTVITLAFSSQSKLWIRRPNKPVQKFGNKENQSSARAGALVIRAASFALTAAGLRPAEGWCR
jgi:hypothetical protein